MNNKRVKKYRVARKANKRFQLNIPKKPILVNNIFRDGTKLGNKKRYFDSFEVSGNTLDFVGVNGVTYFLVSECGNYMKIGRCRRGSLLERLREINRDGVYCGLGFIVACTVNDWILEEYFQNLFREFRFLHKMDSKIQLYGLDKETRNKKDRSNRCTYKQYCEKNGYRYCSSEIPYLKAGGGIELFQSVGDIRKIVVNELLNNGCEVFES